MFIEEILRKFQGVKEIGEKQFQCLCPTHSDKKASLTITEDGEKILMYCHAGCDTKDILNAVGLKESDLFNNKIQEKPKVVKEYLYKDENGNTIQSGNFYRKGSIITIIASTNEYSYKNNNNFALNSSK